MLKAAQTQHQGQDDSQVQRNRWVVQIRKANRDQIFMQRRKMIEKNTSTGNSIAHSNKIRVLDQRYKTQIEEMASMSYDAEMLPDLITKLYSTDIIQIHQAVIGIRKLIIQNDLLHLDLILTSSALQMLIQLSTQPSYPQLSLQSTWSLSSIACGSSQTCKHLLQKDIINILMGLLTSQHPQIIQQAIIGLGNLSIDATSTRDQIIQKDGLDKLMGVLIGCDKMSRLWEYGMWAISNLCRGDPKPQYGKIQKAIKFMCLGLGEGMVSNPEVVADILFAIFKNITPKHSSTYMQTNLIGVVVGLLKHNMEMARIRIPCLRNIGTISSGSDEEVDQLLQQGVLQVLQGCLGHEHQTTRRQACWILSNIAAGSQQQASRLFYHPTIMTTLLQMLQTDKPNVKKQISYILANFTSRRAKLPILKWVQQMSVMDLLVEQLEGESSLVCAFLDNIDKLLQYAGDYQEHYGAHSCQTIQEIKGSKVYTRHGKHGHQGHHQLNRHEKHQGHRTHHNHHQHSAHDQHHNHNHNHNQHHPHHNKHQQFVRCEHMINRIAHRLLQNKGAFLIQSLQHYQDSQIYKRASKIIQLYFSQE